MNLLFSICNLLLNSQPYIKLIAPFLAGVALFHATQTEKTTGLWLRLGLLLTFIFLGTFFAFNYLVQPTFKSQVSPFPISDLYISLLFFTAGLASYFVWLREGQPWLDARAERITKRSSLERNKKTDVRQIADFLPQVEKQYDPREHFNQKKGFFLGLTGDGQAFWPASVLPHVQVVGTTGAGKGVVLGSLAAQCLMAGEAVFWLDPKDDEWAPHVLADAAHAAGKPFLIVDLRPAAPPQLNLFFGATKEQREELLLAGFSLSEKGAESDFYSIDDRWGAATVASDYQPGDTAASLFNRHREALEDKAKKFFGLFREMAEMPAVNAKQALTSPRLWKKAEPFISWAQCGTQRSYACSVCCLFASSSYVSVVTGRRGSLAQFVRSWTKPNITFQNLSLKA